MKSGIINVYKERGYTSFDVVAKLRGILKERKIGHTGTLDPDAEGVLPVCIGKGTRLVPLLTDKDKEYEAVLLLGRTTDTQDCSGRVISEREVCVSREDVRKAAEQFVGTYDQIPPMYSALKVGGKKLCDLARKGVEIERSPRPVTIYSLQILRMELPRVWMRVNCSRGTYIRTLCQDIGEKLGCGGCMETLLRTRVDRFELTDAHRLSEIEQMAGEGRVEEWILSPDQLFLNLPAGTVISEAQKRADNGNELACRDLSEDRWQTEAIDGDSIRAYRTDGRFIGIYEYKKDRKAFKPVKLFLE